MAPGRKATRTAMMRNRMKKAGIMTLLSFLNAGGHAEDQDGGRHRHRREVPGDGAEVHRQGGEEALSVPGQDGAGEGACGVPQHPAHHHRVADGDAQHPQQGDGAQHPAAPAAPLPEHVVQRAHGAGAGEAAQGELPRQAHIAEQGDEQEIGDQERRRRRTAPPGRERARCWPCPPRSPPRPVQSRWSW